MSRLFQAYRAFHQQAFAPIFVHDHFDSKKLLEGCLAAGCKGIEYTLRRPDAPEMIPWIRKNYPELFLLVGSTIDDEGVVRKMRRRHPQLRTVAELADMDVDGFVSMLGWTEHGIRKYAPTHVIMPTAMTVTEALLQTSWGAHFQKLIGNDIGFIKRCRGDAAFDYCPIIVTGGQTPATIPATIQAGAIMIGTGFDLTLKGQPADVGVPKIAEVMRQYLQVSQQARAQTWPDLAKADAGPKQAWLDALPHWHPF